MAKAVLAARHPSLIVAANDVHRFVCDLLDFPSTRGRAAQARELQALAERRDELGRRRDELVRRLQRADLSRAVSG